MEARGDAASWTTMGSYTWTQARASAGSFGGDLDPDQQIEGIPEHQASLWAVHDFTHLGFTGFRFGGGVRYVGRIGDGTGDVFVPAVTLFDLMGSYAIRNWRLSFNVNNLTDKPYIATCLARGDCWFGQRRTLSVTTRLHLLRDQTRGPFARACDQPRRRGHAVRVLAALARDGSGSRPWARGCSCARRLSSGSGSAVRSSGSHTR